jgi:branched-chain amino acid transport system substrate-binding protein
MAQPATKTPYVVGSTNELTGASAATGRPFVAGASTYFKWLNDNGGASGHPIQVIPLDDQSNPDTGVANTRRLLSQGAVAILGPSASAVGIPMLPILNEVKVPMIAYTAVEQMESDAYYYAVGVDGTTSFKIIAQYLKSRVTSRPKIAFLTLDTPAGTAARDATIKTLQGWGWPVVASESFAAAANDFNASVLKIAAASPDFVISSLTDGKSPIAVPALQRAGVRVPVLNFQSGNAEWAFRAISSDLFMAIREYLDPTDPSSEATKPLRDAAAKYGTKGEMTSDVFTKGWVAAAVLAAAIASCGDDCTGEKVKSGLDQLANFDTKGLGPSITFSPTQKRGISSARLYRWDAKLGHTVAATDFVDVSP